MQWGLSVSKYLGVAHLSAQNTTGQGV
jgi:hypothetical protein